ncbi:Transcriptional regulator calD [Paramyrothecium foliicola]|nr:Transcriptional regulator calD [Paramyrothecium foliicola]
MGASADLNAAPNGSKHEIIPIHRFDSTPILSDTLIHFMFRFDEVLQPQKLINALEELLNMQGWRKLGARLKRSSSGKLEYHIPSTFDATQPAVMFSHVAMDVTIENHPVAGKIPRPNGGIPRVVADADAFDSLMRSGHNPPQGLKDWIKRQLPQLELHVVIFSNASVITITCLHSTMDVMGIGMDGLIGAWMSIMRDERDKIPPLCGINEDLFQNLGEDPSEPYKLEDRFMTKPQVLFWLCRLVLKSLKSVHSEKKVVFVPAAFIKAKRESILRELANASPDEKGQNSATFVSEGDILAAWWSRYATLHLQDQPDRTVTINNAYGLRSPLSGNVLPQDHAYLSNAVGSLFLLTKVGDISSKPLSWLAARFRQCITDMGTREQIEAMMSHFYPKKGPISSYKMVGDMWMHAVAFTNWTKGRLFQFDAASATASAESGEVSSSGSSKKNPVLPSYIGGHIRVKHVTLDNFWIVLGKDADGNYWLSGALSKARWAQIEKELEKESTEKF